ncbi:hypothetical protein [Kineococcus rhizosphaerae]|uniref:ABC-2 type transport system permease protein n=1 Tax=Kineococcus rhizosphaerae TaxID=559628 RepID=A0A2T0R0F9_9ACTN|nr:hypothetical protein [Kineococcus rhizosphaerae]PRY12548.1 ABC-2 type transport system permease protein [Kineococcus rhizosphaerae]
MTSAEVPSGAVTPSRVLAAEWTKVASLASTPWTVVGTVGSAGVLAFVLGLFAGPGHAVSATSLVTSGYQPAQLGALVLGVLVGSADFATGTSLTTYAAVPRRLPVLGAQVVVTAALTLAAGLLALAASVAATTGARRTTGLAWSAADPGDLRAAVGYVLFLAGVGVCGVGLGALLRRPLAALTSGVALFVLLDQVLAANPGRVADTVRALLPSGGAGLFADDARLAALAAGPGPDLGPWGAGLVLGAWCAGLALLAGYRLARRDVT